MSDRTQLHIGKTNMSVPKVLKRALEIAMGVGLTAFAILVVLTLNTVLTGNGGWFGGYTLWMQFIQKTDVMATMILTAAVTVGFIYWYRAGARR
ncbi:MAG: hypothetical protein ACFCUN_06845 [Hyphomicrobiaceae bacterium]